jgi:hypothetical protein
MPKMDASLSHDRQKRSFLWGIGLTGILFIPIIIGCFNAFRGIAAEHATGLGAVAGGLAEAYVTLGVLLSLALPVAAIALLFKSFSAGHRMRGLISILCICACVLSLALAALFVWAIFVFLPHISAGSIRPNY